MKKLFSVLVFSLAAIVAGCAQFSQTSQKLSKGIQFSSNMSQEEIDEEAQSGQMRNIK